MCLHDACTTVSVIVIISSNTHAVVRSIASIGLFLPYKHFHCINTEDMFSCIWQLHLVEHETHNHNVVIASIGILIQALQLKYTLYTSKIVYYCSPCWHFPYLLGLFRYFSPYPLLLVQCCWGTHPRIVSSLLCWCHVFLCICHLIPDI